MHWVKKVGVLLIAILGIWSCDTSSPEPHKSSASREITAQEKILINQSNQLLFKYFQVIEKETPGQNIFFSPISIGMTLGMMNNCAAGATKSQLQNAFGFSGFSDAEINKSFSELNLFLQSLDQEVKIGMANTFWHRHNVKIAQPFKDIIMAYYDADAEGINFRSNHLHKYINRIIENKTNGQVTSAIDKINPEFESFIYNAAGFSAAFENKFEAVIDKGQFAIGKNNEISTPFFFKEAGVYRYFEDEMTLAVDIPLGNSQFSFMTLMPKKSTSKKLNFYQFNEIADQMDTALFNFSMPVFKTESEFNLNTLFAQTGFPKVIDGTANYLIGDKGEHVSVNKLTHRAAINLTQSSENIANKNLKSSELPANLITIDRPFFYYIKEKHTGLIMFAGKVVNPGA
jgi:serine protease inhibitor